MTKAACFLVLVVAACSSTPATSASSGNKRLVDGEPIARHEMKRIEPSADYPLTTCVVTGEELTPGHRIAYSYEGTEVQFCCPHCSKDFQKDPEKYLAQIRAASK